MYLVATGTRSLSKGKVGGAVVPDLLSNWLEVHLRAAGEKNGHVVLRKCALITSIARSD